MTPELKEWIYKERPNLCPSFLVVSSLRQSMPRGLTASELWEKVTGLHEELPTKRVMKRLLVHLCKEGYKGHRVVMAAGKPHFHYLVVPRVSDC